MAKKGQKKLVRKETLYQKLSKRITAYNKTLPNEERIPIERRREIIQKLKPSFLDTPVYKVKVKDIIGQYQIEAQKKTRKVSEAQKFSKRFTELNKKLPKEEQLSLSQRRKILKSKAIKDLQGQKVTKKLLDQILNEQLKGYCNPFMIDPSFYSFVQWFEIDDRIRSFPECVYVQVDASIIGLATDIFNTKNYDYVDSGVQEIVEAIREEYDNGYEGVAFDGTIQVRPNKKNDGFADSYFIQLVLVNEEELSSLPPSVVSPIGKTPKPKSTKKKVTDLIKNRITKLKVERQKVSTAKKRLVEKTNNLKEIVSSKSKNKLKLAKDFAKNYQNGKRLADRYLEKGYITKKKYKEIIKDLESKKNRFRKK